MNFLLLVVLYMLQRRFDIPFSRVFDRKLELVLKRSHWHTANAAYLFIGITILLALLFYVALESISQDYFGLLYFFAEFLILLFLLGDSGFKEQIMQFSASAEKGDHTGAHHILSACYPTEAVYRISSPAELRYQACHWLLEESFRRYFLVIFWFALAGAPAALMVRMFEQIERRKTGDQIEIFAKVYELAAFVPSRILAFSFAFTGNFSTCYRVALEKMLDLNITAVNFLHLTAQGALGEDCRDSSDKRGSDSPQYSQTTTLLTAIRELLNRSLGVWFMVLALFALAGWM